MKEIDQIVSLIKEISQGLQYTLGLFALTLIVSIPLGMLLAFARKGSIAPVRGLIGGYVWVMRGTPLLLQLFFFYYGLPNMPYVGKYMIMSRFGAACLAFILNYAAYYCEIFRGGLISVEKGQYEAAHMLGFSKWQTSMKIVMPQMLRVSLPSVTNECITLVKDTSLITAIGVTEILYFTKSAVNRDVSFTAYIVAAAFYLIFTFVLTKLFNYLEKRLAY